MTQTDHTHKNTLRMFSGCGEEEFEHHSLFFINLSLKVEAL